MKTIGIKKESDMTIQEQCLLDSLRVLERSFKAVLDAIELNEEFDDLISIDYPFEKSFDEMAWDVSSWVDIMEWELQGEGDDI